MSSVLRHRSWLSPSGCLASRAPGSSSHLHTHLTRPRLRVRCVAPLTYHVLIIVFWVRYTVLRCCGHHPPFIHSVNIYLGKDPWAGLTASPVHPLHSLWKPIKLAFSPPSLLTLCLPLQAPPSCTPPPSPISTFLSELLSLVFTLFPVSTSGLHSAKQSLEPLFQFLNYVWFMVETPVENKAHSKRQL